MYREKRILRATGFDAGAGFFAVLVIISMFFTYVTADFLLFQSTRTGFKLLDYDGAAGRPFLIISMILAVGILAVSILRLIKFPLFNARLLSTLYAIAGVALIVVSVILMITAVKVKIGDGEIEVAERGIGLILHLVFSVIVAACCIGSGTATLNE